MDNHSWAPARGLVTVGWAAAVIALALTVLASDAAGRVLGAVAVVGLGAAAVFGTVARPRLAVDNSGITVRGLLATRRWSWAQVHRLRVLRHRRLGREVATLELDAVNPDGTESLVVLTRLDLDAHPEDVLATVRSVRGLA